MQYLLQLAVIVVTMLVLSWPLGLLVMLTLPLIAWPAAQARPYVGGHRPHPQGRRARQWDSAGPGLDAGAEFARSAGRGNSRRFSRTLPGEPARHTLASIADLRRTLRIPHYLLQTFKLSMDNMQAGVTLLVIGAGAGLSFAGWLSLGTYSAFILFLPVAMHAIGNLAAYVQDLGHATLSLDRIEAVRSAELPARDAHASTLLTRPIQGIRFEQFTSAIHRTAPTSVT